MSFFDCWKNLHTAPYHFPMTEAIWQQSMVEDVDSDGRKLFDRLVTEITPEGSVQYGWTAFGFDESGEISDQVHYPVIRDLAFDAADVGQKLLDRALFGLDSDGRVYAFFHYFGMSACARHGKLHESSRNVHDLLLKNGFCIEHENVYYSKMLTPTASSTPISLLWKEQSSGGCREFAALMNEEEVCWGQVHFLPQGDIAYLRWIFTDGNRQHQGIGTKVMHSLFDALYSMGIRRFDTDTALNNTAAQGYYEKCGFQNMGITRSYYTK